MIQIILFIAGALTVAAGGIEYLSAYQDIAAASDAFGVVLRPQATTGAVLWVGGFCMIGLSALIGLARTVIKSIEARA
ncbi:hypothetical protein [Martelella soudanensis]|uniref:hypothetical protein n=1 Tax=unclassified Martelella TaxID=2629616 RepID=UPI0015E02B2C|nr:MULTISPECIES: hypothetical protein [unclassified Martelella]